MVTITLKNGSKMQIDNLYFKGKIIDSNGEPVGGNTTYPFSESEVDALNAIVPIQTMYDAVFVPPTSDEPQSE